MKRISFLGKFILLSLLTGGLVMSNASSKSGVKETAYQYSFTNMEGESLPLKTYQGKVILIVNTASQCGFTPQYKELEALYERYQKKGLVVLGVPSGDFGGQEFKHDQEVAAFTKDKFAVTFPLTSINHVKGFQAHPFYQWAKKKYGFIGSPKWNFHKYLVSREGKLVNWFYSQTKPLSPKVVAAIEEELNKSV